MVMHKCPKCGGMFSAPKYVHDYIHDCPDKIEKYERVNIEGDYTYREANPYPHTRSKSEMKRNQIYKDWPVKKFIELG